MSATTLARAIGMSIKCATELLDRFVEDGVAVEVTHRCARRLFGLAGMAPLRDATSAPRRPLPGRGRPREELEELAEASAVPPISRFERRPIDYSGLDAAMDHCGKVIRDTRRCLERQTRADGEPLQAPHDSRTDSYLLLVSRRACGTPDRA